MGDSPRQGPPLLSELDLDCFLEAGPLALGQVDIHDRIDGESRQGFQQGGDRGSQLGPCGVAENQSVADLKRSSQVGLTGGEPGAGLRFTARELSRDSDRNDCIDAGMAFVAVDDLEGTLSDQTLDLNAPVSRIEIDRLSGFPVFDAGKIGDHAQATVF